MNQEQKPRDDPSTPKMDEHWVRTLYERYVQLYGDPIERPITPKKNDDEESERTTP